MQRGRDELADLPRLARCEAYGCNACARMLASFVVTFSRKRSMLQQESSRPPLSYRTGMRPEPASSVRSKLPLATQKAAGEAFRPYRNEGSRNPRRSMARSWKSETSARTHPWRRLLLRCCVTCLAWRIERGSVHREAIPARARSDPQCVPGNNEMDCCRDSARLRTKSS